LYYNYTVPNVTNSCGRWNKISLVDIAAKNWIKNNNNVKSKKDIGC